MATKLSIVLFATLAAVAALHSSAVATTYFVGDSSNWVIPSSSNFYSNWAANKKFVVGDVLVFNFTENRHDVAEVTKSGYDACNGTTPISLQTSSPANITLRGAGEHYYICTFTGHCNNGQKLAINVTGASSSAPQPSSASPSPTPLPAPALAPQPSSPSPSSSPARGPLTYTVGDTMGWGIPSGGASAYQTWASNKTFLVGDILVFNFANGTHDVAEVTKEDYDSCNTDSTISLNTNPPVRITLTTPGEHFFTCTFTGHCDAGQKLAINVTSGGGSPATPPSSGATPPNSAATPPSAATTPPSIATPPSSGTSAPPPQDNGASSLGLAGLSATFFSIVSLALCLYIS